MDLPKGRGRRTAVSILVAAIAAAPFFSSPAVAGEESCKGPALLEPVCEVGKTAAGAVSEAVTAPVRHAADSAVDMVTGAVAESATWLLQKVVRFIRHSTSPDLSADWFLDRYSFMTGLGALVLVPMLLFAAIRAIVQQDVSQLVRSFFVHLPVAVLGTFLAIHLAQGLLVGTDALSAAVAKGIAGDLSPFFDSVGRALVSPSSVTTQPSIPAFALLLGAFLLIVGSFVVWLELVVRSAAVTVSAFFLPLILAGLVWPATAHWTKRLVQTLVALILSKFVIVSVISLATAAVAEPGDGGFGTIMGAAALMLMAAFSPVALMKLMPLAEGAAVGHLEGMGRRPIGMVQRGMAMNHAISVMRSKGPGGQPSPQLATARSGPRHGAPPGIPTGPTTGAKERPSRASVPEAGTKDQATGKPSGTPRPPATSTPAGKRPSGRDER